MPETKAPADESAEAPEEQAQDESKDDEAVAEKAEETSSADSPLETMKATVGAMKEQNDRFEKNLKEMNKIAAETIVAGRSFATKEKSEEEKAKEAAASLVAGTGLDPFAAPAE